MLNAIISKLDHRIKRRSGFLRIFTVAFLLFLAPAWDSNPKSNIGSNYGLAVLRSLSIQYRRPRRAIDSPQGLLIEKNRQNNEYY